MKRSFEESFAEPKKSFHDIIQQFKAPRASEGSFLKETPSSKGSFVSQRPTINHSNHISNSCNIEKPKLAIYQRPFLKKYQFPTLASSSSSKTTPPSLIHDIKEYEKDLSPEQWDAFQNIVISKKSTLILGSAGSGKSFLIDKIRQYCEENNRKYAVTASTGNAAMNIKGTTIHTFCGLGIAEEPLDQLKSRWLDPKNRGCYFKFMNIWKDLELLIIDEISMIQPDFLSKLNILVGLTRKRANEYFGGVQIVFLGDFLQLPPVMKNLGKEEVKMTFQMKEFPSFFQHVTILKKIYRQSDTQFSDLLNRIRYGTPTLEDHQILKSRVVPFHQIALQKPTRIVTRLEQAKHINQQELEKISSPSVFFNAYSGFKTMEQFQAMKNHVLLPKKSTIQKTSMDLERHKRLEEMLKKNCPVDSNLELKKDAKILLTVNLDLANGLVNGSRGTILHFDHQVPHVQFDNGICMDVHFYEWMAEDKSMHGFVTHSQIPLKLAYAITIHKSQSMTLSNVYISLDGIFEKGQAYVALSRVTSLQGLYLESYKENDIKSNRKVIEFENNLKEALEKGIQGQKALEYIPYHHSIFD